MLQSLRITLLAAALLATGVTTAQDKPAAKPPASGGTVTVNGQAIPASRFDALLRQAAAQGQPDSPQLRDAVKQELINREVVAQEAIRRGLDKSPEFQAQLDMLRQQLLFQSFLNEYARANQPKDPELKSEYDKVRAAQGDKEYRARHILVKTEDEARDIIGQLGKGGKFEALAAERSLDPGSKTTGGSLDWAPAGAYVKPFSDALTKLKKGETTRSPIQTQFGWHVIQLQDERPVKVPSFDEVRGQIAQRVMQQSMQKAIQDLRAKAKIVE